MSYASALDSPNNEGVAFTKLVLEMLRGAKAAEAAVGHNSQASAQRLALLHTASTDASLVVTKQHSSNFLT